jgi:mRNA interferase MazF
MKRGEIYWATLVPRSGSEQTGRRPVIVVSRDVFNQAPGWRAVIVIPISTSISQARRGPTAVALPKGAGGLTQGSVALCHQVTTLDRQKLDAMLGSLDMSQMRAVEDGLRIALGMV